MREWEAKSLTQEKLKTISRLINRLCGVNHVTDDRRLDRRFTGG
jgi:hypothetical protein